MSVRSAEMISILDYLILLMGSWETSISGILFLPISRLETVKYPSSRSRRAEDGGMAVFIVFCSEYSLVGVW